MPDPATRDDKRQPCPQCGALNYLADDICVSCGYDLPPPGKAKPPPPAPEAPRAGEPAPPPPPPRRWFVPSYDDTSPASSAGCCAGLGCLGVGALSLLIDLALFPSRGTFEHTGEWVDTEFGSLVSLPFAAVGGVVGWVVSPSAAQRLGMRLDQARRLCLIAGIMLGTLVGIAFRELIL